ncbi:hypothetical protein RM531_08845 [Salinisphaera sp. P385]|uniref:Uncharacterized protein n=1 Tax=Spectribacter acetivorans TaxID=3075603 RepID=A0ABU3B941_9GAMM|nr:hypothetical protein [Salinisphaera sp. P385]MDT0618585.1 hypothetical protein [Salinisphaera sp. P385]
MQAHSGEATSSETAPDGGYKGSEKGAENPVDAYWAVVSDVLKSMHRPGRERWPQCLAMALCDQASDGRWVKELDGRELYVAGYELRNGRRMPDSYEVDYGSEFAGRVRRYWKTLSEGSWWQEAKAVAEERLADAGIPAEVALARYDAGAGGSGNAVVYGLAIRARSNAHDTPKASSPKLADNEVRYEVSRLPEMPRLGRFLGNLRLAGMSGAFFYLTVSLIVAVSIVVAYAAVITASDKEGLRPWVTTMVVLVFSGWILWRSVGAFVSVQRLGVVVAPAWMRTRIDHPTLLLEFKYDPQRRVDQWGYEVKRLRLSAYEGRCKLCGGELEIREGSRWRHPGRLVGTCRNAPREHLYSFDPVLRVGRRLHD